MKAFELLNPKSGDVEVNYKNNQPRQAALKAANHGHTDILLREADSAGEGYVARLHRFKGTVGPAVKFLPIKVPWILAKIEKDAGKKVPPELNVAGKEAEYAKAGFKPISKPNVQKVGSVIHVPKIEGKDLAGCIHEYLKTLK